MVDVEIKPKYSHTKVGTALFNICAIWTKFLVRHRVLYYVFASTWGVLMTVAGLVVTLVLAIASPFTKGQSKILFEPYYWIYNIKVGKRSWGGLELGLCFLTGRSSAGVAPHEFGHTFQNCLFGPLFPFVVALPSAIWYHSNRKGKPYDSLWFEDAASQCGLYVTAVLDGKKGGCNS